MAHQRMVPQFSNPDREPGELSVWSLATLVLRRRRLFILLPPSFAVLLITLALFGSRTYSTSMMFSSESGASSLAGIQDIAAQFGVNVGGAGTSMMEAPDFYVTLLQSDGFLRSLAESQFSAVTDGTPARGNYSEIMQLGLADSVSALKAAVDLLRSQIDARVDVRSQLVMVTVTASDSSLAVQLGARILALVDTFNAVTRETRARREYDFIAARLSEARGELAKSEGEMQQFLAGNRDFRNSPTLLFENGRLQRDLDLRQGIVTQLAQSLEAARIELVRNTPVITVVQGPIAPLVPDRRHLLLRGLLGVALGLLLAGFGVVVEAAVSQSSGVRSQEFAECSELLRELRNELRHPIRSLRSWLPKRAGSGYPE